MKHNISTKKTSTINHPHNNNLMFGKYTFFKYEIEYIQTDLAKKEEGKSSSSTFYSLYAFTMQRCCRVSLFSYNFLFFPRLWLSPCSSFYAKIGFMCVLCTYLYVLSKMFVTFIYILQYNYRVSHTRHYVHIYVGVYNNITK